MLDELAWVLVMFGFIWAVIFLFLLAWGAYDKWKAQRDWEDEHWSRWS